MPPPEMTPSWYTSPFTGLFRRCGPVPPRPHDPAVSAWAGEAPGWEKEEGEVLAGGAGWDAASAEAAAVGEAVERCLARRLPQDAAVEASYESWPLDEPAVEPERWVLFHPGQYGRPGFPFAPFTRAVRCGWVCCREALTGAPRWVPEKMVFLTARPSTGHRIGPAVSTGLACGRAGHPVVLRGLQEVIERDAVTGAWWGAYRLEEHDAGRVLAALGPATAGRLSRPNLRYRCYRVASPFSAHVTLVTIEGEDREGWCFNVGSACRETRAESWRKAFLEAVQGRHYVRQLKTAVAESGRIVASPTDFAEHAVYYSLHPMELAATVLNRAAADDDAGEAGCETLPVLAERLGPGRPVLFRLLTPPFLSAERLDWAVVRVLAPGLQPLHGCHELPYLGGALWAPRGADDWARVPPHPFP